MVNFTCSKCKLHVLIVEIFCWFFLFTTQLWITRYLIALNGTPKNASILVNSLKASSIDLPFILIISLIPILIRKIFLIRISSVLFFLPAFTFVAVNYANTIIYQNLGRNISVSDFCYITQNSFIKGSIIPSLASTQCIFLFLIPLIAIILMHRFFSRNSYHLTNLIPVIVTAAILVFFIRRWGFTNQVLRCIPSSQSTYTHSIFGSDRQFLPLSKSEKNILDSLHSELFSKPYLRADTLLKKGYPDIVLIILESFPAVYIDSVIDGITVTPQMNQLKKQGRWYKNFYSNSSRTSQAQWSMFSGELASDKLIFTKLPNSEVKYITDILKNYGYTNIWMHGNTSDFDNRQYVFERHNFDRIIDKKAFPPPYTKLAWGISDHEFLERCIPKLDSFYHNDSPFFSVILTMSNHHPYIVPDSFDVFRKADGVNAHFLNTLHYSDYALGEFFSQIQKKEWFDSTYFIITSDNGSTPFGGVNNLKQKIDNYFKTPLLIIGPGIMKNVSDKRFVSHVDIASTINHIASGELQRIGIGYSLLTHGNPAQSDWIPLTGTFFGHMLISSSGIITEKTENDYRYEENIPQSEIDFFRKSKKFVSLWERALVYRQSGTQ